MLVLIVLIVATLVLRGLGFAGVQALASWHDASRDGLAVMLLFTSSAHFTSMKEDLIRMTPSWVPNPRAMVFFTGLCEIAGAIGLVIPALQHAAAIALILFFITVLPANIHAARAEVTLRGRPATPLWLRVPMQILFIGLAWWSAQ
ncbi:MAG TPA: DoxX family protein [Candidatus Bathyarchaeia archaeon]|jgi:uncharacterized membrane protein|nr:DoxX family protein [Candidatus Bathyarchaeia archaeon]